MFEGLAPVKSYASNDYGLFDMSGNVREWCADLFGGGGSNSDPGNVDYYSVSPPRDPQGPRAGPSRVVRGGGCIDDDRRLRASYRLGVSPHSRDEYTGFRLAKGL